MVETGPTSSSALVPRDPTFHVLPEDGGHRAIPVQAAAPEQPNGMAAASLDVWERLSNRIEDLLLAAPLVVVAIAVFFAVFFLSGMVARWLPIPEGLMRSPFQQQLLRQTIQTGIVILGLVLALEIVDASSLIGAVLGAAGITGIVLGFALKETLENYVAGLLLSWRQPFSANDLIQVQGHEGHVIRLTSRATVLLSPDGNHVRIANADVARNPLVNFTRNPERRFDFEIGVGVDVDLSAAQALAITTLSSMNSVLKEPGPDAWIEGLGDSNVVIRVVGWIDQARYDFHNVRGEAIRQTKAAFEACDYDLPEPIYRLRLTKGPPVPLLPATAGTPDEGPEKSAGAEAGGEDEERLLRDDHLDQEIAKERAELGEGDLLDPDAPKE